MDFASPGFDQEPGVFLSAGDVKADLIPVNHNFNKSN